MDNPCICLRGTADDPCCASPLLGPHNHPRNCGAGCIGYAGKYDHKMTTFRIYGTTRLDSLCLAHAPAVVFFTPNGGCLNIICDDPTHARSLLIAALQQLDEEIERHGATRAA